MTNIDIVMRGEQQIVYYVVVNIETTRDTYFDLYSQKVCTC